jgi:hypothetical protein
MQTRSLVTIVCTGALLLGGVLLAQDRPEGVMKERPAPTLPGGSTVIGVPPADKENLAHNSGFEEATADGDGPAHWDKTDNLVYFWTRDPDAPDRGRVMKIDTDVAQKQGYAWWVQRYLHNAPLTSVPAKEPTREPKYDTIAGLDGGFYWSDYIPIKPGKAYKVYLDAKGPASKVFIRGYEKELPISFADENKAVQEVFRQAKGEPLKDEKGRPIRYFNRYKYSTWFTVGGSNEWRTYTHEKPRHPTSRELTEDVRFIRIMFYPYWPPATYWYDNVRVYEVEPDPDQARAPAEEADLEEGKVIR